MVDWIEKIPEFLKMSWSDFSKVMIGVFLTGFLAYGWVRQARRHAADRTRAARDQARHEVEAARDQAILVAEAAREQARADVEAARAQAHQASADQAARAAADAGALHRTVADLRQAEHKIKVERDGYLGQYEALRQRLTELEAFDGKLWDREVMAEPPVFVPAPHRRTRFIAVANLKGGVGKTTVAANAGMALAKRGKNVLLVDLDFQGSLTRLCIDYKALRDLVKKGETVRALFDLKDGPIGDWLTRIIRPVTGTPAGAGACDFVAAFDDLADVELREEARWFVTRKPDVRFRFRQVLHAPEVTDRYDYVFFDCPPRLTVASVNAWACADWLLVPVILDQQSVQAVPRTLDWLRRLGHVSRARLLGIVANEVAYRGDKLVARYQTALDQLPGWLNRLGFDTTGAFCAAVRTDTTTIAHAASDGHIPAVNNAADPLFAELVNEIERTVRR